MGLEAAQIQQLGLIGNAVLWNGQAVTLVGVSGTDAYLDTGTSSAVAPLSELDLVGAASRLVSNNGHFTSPSVFRAVSISESATCSVAAEDDPSLQACFDPGNPENLDEILRQTTACDEEMSGEGRAALREAARQARAQGPEAEAAFNNRIREALEEIAQENPDEVAAAEQAFYEVQSTLPARGSEGAPSQQGNGSGNRGSNGGTSGSGTGPGGGVPVASNGNGISTVYGTAGEIPVAGLGGASDGPILLTVASHLPAGDRPVSVAGSSPTDSDESAQLATVAAAALPVVLSAFTLAMPAFLPAAALGALMAPRNPDVRAEAGFFQNLFDRLPVTDTASGLVDLLTNPTSAFAPKVYEVRRAVAEVMRTYRATYGSASPFETSSIPLSFRYNPDRRRIEVSIRPAVAGGHSFGAAGNREEAPSRFSDLVASFPSLSLFRLGSDDHRAGSEFGFGPIVAIVPVPQQYLQGVRVGDGTVTVRADGPSVERIARRDEANDQHGGSRSGGREGRGSRGGGGEGDGERDDRDDRDPYPSADEGREAMVA